MGRTIPRCAEQRAGRAKAVQYVLWTCCLLVAAPVGLFAQNTAQPQLHWINKPRFYVPFTMNLNDTRIADVMLYVATDKDPTYRHVATVRPAEGRFLYQAPGDGWYSFAVQTRSRDNILTPADLNGVPPGRKVCVDSRRPVISLREAQAQDGSPVAIQWSIQDDNFADLSAHYRSVNGGEWYTLFLPRSATGTHGWTPAVSGPLEVRMQALDKAKNEATPQSLTVTPKRLPPGVAPVAPTNASDIKHVKSKTFQMEYQLDDATKGPSGVASVDIWKIREGGPWQKCSEKGTPQGPATVSVEATGRWGFRLIPRSGVGLADPDPRPGEPPDLWVEVDDKAPVVKVTGVVVGQGADSGKLTVTWTASDPFMSRYPISIYYSAVDQPEQWKLIAEKLDNTGSYPCEPQKLGLPFQFLIKVTAADEAGNIGEDKWMQPVKVDLKVPRIKHIGVKIGEGSQRTQDTTPPRGQIPLSGMSPTVAPVSRPAAGSFPWTNP